MAARRDGEDCGIVLLALLFLLLVAVTVGVIGFLIHLAWLGFTSGDTEYTVTITSADGLDPAALRQRSDVLAALSPVFGIAVRIDNARGKVNEKCVGMRSSAVVSYWDAVLGKGTVPEFCASTLGVGEVATRAWGMDVQVPRFLRDQLAGELERGEAVLDVAVRTPGNCRGCMDTVLVCKPKIGGGPSPCFVTKVYQRLTPDELL